MKYESRFKGIKTGLVIYLILLLIFGVSYFQTRQYTATQVVTVNMSGLASRGFIDIGDLEPSENFTFSIDGYFIIGDNDTFIILCGPCSEQEGEN